MSLAEMQLATYKKRIAGGKGGIGGDHYDITKMPEAQQKKHTLG